MKKLLSLALALTMVLGLCCPARALTPDLTAYEDYEAAHPEEFENLDTAALIAGWGYTDMTAEEAFREDNYIWKYATTEGAVKEHYIDNRLSVQYKLDKAAEYKVLYAEDWANFDVEDFFARFAQGALPPERANKEAYMAYENILTDAELADVMFAQAVDWDDFRLHDTDVTPTLTLYVNGVAADVEVTAADGVTYAEAAALRQLLGPEAVPADAEGPVAIRPAAETAGWDVGWYGGGWQGVNRQVQLWDKASYEAYLAEEFGPFHNFLAQSVTAGANSLFSETSVASHQTVTADLTRFSTLDGDETCRLTFEVDCVTQRGMVDLTVTFDMAQLLTLLPQNTLRALEAFLNERGVDFSLAQLTALLRAGKLEFLLDCNTGYVAYNIPLLALLDESMAGWQYDYLDGLDSLATVYQIGEDAAFLSTLYAQMVTAASVNSVEYAFEDYNNTVALLSTLVGKDRFTTRGGQTVYSLTTEEMNGLITSLLLADYEPEEGAEPPRFSFFKYCDLTYTLNADGSAASSFHLRPDLDGITTALLAGLSSAYGYADGLDDFFTFAGTSLVAKLLTSAADVDVAAASSSNADRATSQMDLHWNNTGKLTLRSTAATQPTNKAPRRVDEVMGWESEVGWSEVTPPAFPITLKEEP